MCLDLGYHANPRYRQSALQNCIMLMQRRWKTLLVKISYVKRTYSKKRMTSLTTGSFERNAQQLSMSFSPWPSVVSPTLKDRIAKNFHHEISRLRSFVCCSCSSSSLMQERVTISKPHVDLSCLQHPAMRFTERLPCPFADFAVEQPETTLKVSDVFPGRLAEGHLHIIVKLPGSGNTASWSKTYPAKKVLSTKLDLLLRSFKHASIAAVSSPPHIDNEVGNEVDEGVMISMTNFARSSRSLSSFWISPVWNLRRLCRGILDTDSAILTSQPGTGKTGYLFFRMVESMIKGCPFVNQSVNDTVYHVSNAITEVNTWASKEAIVAFVDGDKDSVEPKGFIRQPSVQIIAASSPRGTCESWLKQMGNSATPLMPVTAPWSPSELLLTGIFLNPLVPEGINVLFWTQSSTAL